MLHNIFNFTGTTILQILWPAYMRQGNRQPFLLVLKFYFFQKILRINSHVPWPVHPTSNILCPEKILRGTRTPGLSICCHIDGRNGIVFGENVWIGPRVSIISMNHDIYMYDNFIENQPIEIGRDCWLATNSVILPAVKLGPHTIVAAGAVVTKSFPEGNQILAGNPAIVIKKLGAYKK